MLTYRYLSVKVLEYNILKFELDLIRQSEMESVDIAWYRKCHITKIAFSNVVIATLATLNPFIVALIFLYFTTQVIFQLEKNRYSISQVILKK